MYRSRLNEIPTLKSRPTTVTAERYNRVRLALRRLENPLRIELPKLRSLDLILEADIWAIVDRDLNDIPVVAWTDFEHRSSLHQPVPCMLRYYHAHADAIMEKALQKLDVILEARLLQQ
jgi:hypothetical protein